MGEEKSWDLGPEGRAYLEEKSREHREMAAGSGSK